MLNLSRFRFMVMAALLLAGLPVPASATQILLNPGFESGVLAPWFISNGAPVVTGAEAHTGSFSVAAFGPEEIQQNFAPVSTADIIEVSFWVKRLGGPFDLGTFHYSDATTSNFIVDALNQGADDWTFFDVTTELLAAKNLVGFSIFGTSLGPAFLDDFTIESSADGVPEPTSLLLLGTGGLGLLVKTRRRKKPNARNA